MLCPLCSAQRMQWKLRQNIPGGRVSASPRDQRRGNELIRGKICCGRTPMETLEDGKQLWEEKKVA